jgi:type IV pilus assembly protein PilE
MRHKHLGMSLIELMIVVAIVGILSAIAYPNYRQYVIRGNRTDAKTAMMQAAQGLEKCFTRFGRYNSDDCTAYSDLDAEAGVRSPNGKYQLTLALVTDPEVEFSIEAAPLDAQTSDTKCGTLSLDQTGRRGANGTDPTTCW